MFYRPFISGFPLYLIKVFALLSSEFSHDQIIHCIALINRYADREIKSPQWRIFSQTNSSGIK